MPNFFVLGIELSETKYYKTCIICDLVLMAVLFFSYLSNDFVVTTSLLLFATILSVAFLASIIVSYVFFTQGTVPFLPNLLS